METPNNNPNRSTKGASRITTTPLTAKNIRHRTVSSSSTTTAINKKSILPNKEAATKRKTVKTTDGIFLFLFLVV